MWLVPRERGNGIITGLNGPLGQWPHKNQAI